MQHFRVFDRDGILAVILFVFAFASYADTNYYDNRNSNAVSRMGLVLSLVHQGRLDIEAFAPLTTDKALVGGTHYSDKAPGVAFLALPAAAAARAVAMALGRDGGLAPFFEDGHVSGAYDRAAWLATLSTSALLGALGVVAVFGAARLMGAGPAGALFAALACGFGTPYWGWATEFIGHTPAAALLALAVWVALVLGKADRPGGFGFGALFGALLGLAATMEYPAVPAAGVIGLAGICLVARRDAARGLVTRRDAARVVPTALGAAVAGLAVLTPMLAYNAAVFGSPFSVGYQSAVGYDALHSGAVGVSLPRPGIVAELLVLPYRGLFWVAPVLLAAPVAFVVAWRRGGARGAADRPMLVALGLAAGAFLAINAGYAYWDAEYSTGPRYLTAAIPLLALPLGVLFTESGRTGRRLLLALLAVSIAVASVCVRVDMLAPPDDPFPLVDYLLPRFIAGDFPDSISSRALHLTGHARLLPTLVLWSVALAALIPALGRPRLRTALN